MMPHNAFQVCMLVAWAIGWLLFFRAPRLPGKRDEGTPDGGPITIVIPARNEASSLPNLLASLAANRPENARVIVVDDGSEDDTAAIARETDFVELIEAPPLREGWVGKTWACHVGARHAEPGTLVFVDADVRLHGDALQRAVAEQRRRGGLLSVWPRHVLKRPYEFLSAIPNLVTMMGVGAGSLVPPRRVRGGFGPLMVMSSEAYSAIGGHDAVKGEVIEDFMLARLHDEAGYPVCNLAGGRDVSFRMYPDGLGSLLRGWTRLSTRGSISFSTLRFGFIVLWLTFGVGTLTWGGGVPRSFPTMLYGLYAAQMFLMLRQLGNFGVLTALLYPLHILVALGISLHSLWRTCVRRSVVWRGREVSVRVRP